MITRNNFPLQVIEQIKLSAFDSDIIFFLVDTRMQDKQNKKFPKWLKRKTNKPIILIANKCHKSKSLNISNKSFLSIALFFQTSFR